MLFYDPIKRKKYNFSIDDPLPSARVRFCVSTITCYSPFLYPFSPHTARTRAPSIPLLMPWRQTTTTDLMRVASVGVEESWASRLTQQGRRSRNWKPKKWHKRCRQEVTWPVVDCLLCCGVALITHSNALYTCNKWNYYWSSQSSVHMNNMTMLSELFGCEPGNTHARL